MHKAVFFDVNVLLSSKYTQYIERGLIHHYNQVPRPLMIAISNQNLEDKDIKKLTEQMSGVLSSFSQISAIYFCPDERGLSCWRVTRDGVSEIANHPCVEEFSLHEEYKFRIPGSGMMRLAATDFGIELSQSWLIAEGKPENEQAAANAELKGLMPSDIWLNRFKPGMHEIRQVTVPQIEFLEGYRAPNNNN